MAIQTAPVPTAPETTLVWLMTADEYRRLPETNKICELINGEVVMAPSPRPKHQWAAGRLFRLFDDFVTEDARGIAFIAPFDIYLSTFEVYQPDIVVILRENAARLTENGYQGVPDLVVEVLSASNRRKDLVTKAAEYARSGVREYWVVDPTNDRIQVNRLEGGTYVAVASKDGVGRSDVLPRFEVAPAAIFTLPEWMAQTAPPIESPDMVAITPRPRMSVEEFAQITEDGRFDLVEGEVWSMAASGQRHGKYAQRLSLDLGIHVRETGAGEVYTAEFGYMILPDQATVLCPDVSFVTAIRVLPDNDDFYPGPPDIAVEVISPSETSRRVLAKATRYIEAGTTIVWCVYPKKRQIVVYEADSMPEILDVTDTLTGGSVLPGFELPLSTLFEE